MGEMRAARRLTKRSSKRAAGKSRRSAANTSKRPAVATKVALLSGGNPQIAMADGDAPVQAYIAAMPGWKRNVGRRLDTLIARTVPGVRKAVKWNSPFYGIDGQGWFVSFHTFTNYVKVTFFKGTSLRPAPSGGKAKDARWIDVSESDLDETQMMTWIRQAAALPGWGTNAARREARRMTKKPTKKPTKNAESPPALIDARIAELGDWRGKMLARLRALIRKADRDVTEEWKWAIPVWSHDGIICTGETYKKVVKLTFAKGASLKDPSCLFNSSLEGNVRRAIDFHEGDPVNEKALTALIRAAVSFNRSSTRD